MKQRAHSIIGLTVAIILSACAADRDLVSHEALGFTFECSKRFVVGTYASENMSTNVIKAQQRAGIDSSGTNRIALVEPGELGEYKPTAIMRGEVPSINITRYIGKHADFFYRTFCKDEFKLQLGRNTAYRLPGGPGPYGDQAFYYLVPMPNGVIIELSAHKYYWRRKPKTETHYNQDIETIIARMKPAK